MSAQVRVCVRLALTERAPPPASRSTLCPHTEEDAEARRRVSGSSQSAARKPWAHTHLRRMLRLRMPQPHGETVAPNTLHGPEQSDAGPAVVAQLQFS